MPTYVYDSEGEDPTADGRLVRAKLSNGDVKHFFGGKGTERYDRIDKAGGNVELYSGPPGSERLYTTVKYHGTSHGCTTSLWGGPQGHEYKKFTFGPSGTLEVFTADGDNRVCLRRLLPNGKLQRLGLGVRARAGPRQTRAPPHRNPRRYR